MICSHCVNGQTNEAILLCEEAVEPFDFRTPEWSRFCPQDWSAGEDLALEIHREVARAIG
ncbi:MAG: hypothetical protein FJ246_06920 [Nitrospira sp.]|nr:hypothetical protein [Nitrospira sp.]